MKPRSKDQGYRLERRRRNMRRRIRAIAVLGPRPGHPHHRAIWDVLVRAAGAGHFRPWLEPEMFTPGACGRQVKVVPIEVEVRC